MQEALNMFIIDKHINSVINCAAYTEVDQAENNPKIAEQVNAKVVLYLGNALEKVDGKISAYFNRLCI